MRQTRFLLLAAFLPCLLVLGGAAGVATKPAPQPDAATKPAVIGSEYGAATAKTAEQSPEAQAAIDRLWNELYDPPERLAQLDHPAVVYLDIQHPEVIRTQLATQKDPAKTNRAVVMRERFKTLSGLDCLVVHESQVTGRDLEQPQIKALLISGRSKSLGKAKDSQFYDFIRTTQTPIIGFCGGCQMIGGAYGVKTVSMRKLKPDEKDPNPKYFPGQFKEWGFQPIEVLTDDPLFAGLPRPLVCRLAHAFKMADPPEGFQLLASTAECRVQGIKDPRRIVYGVQFHPEAYDDQHAHGRMLLENFFRIALGAKK